MKHKLLKTAIVLLCCLFILSFRSITIKRLPEFFAYSFSCVDPATGKIKAKLQPNTAIKQRAKGKTSTAVTYLLEGSKSSVRLKFEDSYFDMLSDIQTSSLNPMLYIGFHKLTSGKNRRTLVIDPNSGENVIGFNLSPVETNIYRILVGGTLQAGEYAFIDKTTTTPEGHMMVWTFGID